MALKFVKTPDLLGELSKASFKSVIPIEAVNGGYMLKQPNNVSASAMQQLQKAPALAQSIAPIVEVEQDSTTKLTDELVQLEKRLSNPQLKQDLKRQTELRKQLATSVPEGTSEAETYTFKGTLGSVVFSACSVVTAIPDLNKVVEGLGHEVFMKIAKVGVTDLKAYMTEVEFSNVSVKAWGSRSFKAFVEK